MIKQQLPLDVILDDHPCRTLMIGHTARGGIHAPCNTIRVQQLLGRGRGYRHLASVRGVDSGLFQIHATRYGQRYTVHRIDDIPWYPVRDQRNDRVYIPHLRNREHARRNQIGGARAKAGKHQPRTIAQHDIVVIGYQKGLKVFRLSRLGRHAHARVSVRVFGGADQHVNDGGFTNVGKTDHSELDFVLVAGIRLAFFGERVLVEGGG
mmetsp:Transcript_49236/g.73248  ORF Transcript_49236/g.73248 Transcript_49236/m.73248 type:complete len:208 (+) Transcript_49236:902-1525(+)